MPRRIAALAIQSISRGSAPHRPDPRGPPDQRAKLTGEMHPCQLFPYLVRILLGGKSVCTSGALQEVLMRKAILLGTLIIAACLGGCGQASQGEKGDAGPAGPAGPQGSPGPPGPVGPAGAQVRVVQSDCTATSCVAECSADEVLITAYCGVRRTPAVFPSERAASCRTRGAASSPLVGVCAKI